MSPRWKHDAREERQADERIVVSSARVRERLPRRPRLRRAAAASCTGRRRRRGRTGSARSRRAAPAPAAPVRAERRRRFSSRPRSISDAADGAPRVELPAAADGAQRRRRARRGRRASRRARRAPRRGRSPAPRSSSCTPTMVVPHAAATRRTGASGGAAMGEAACHQKLDSFRVSDISRMKVRCPRSPAANSARTRRRK